VGEVLYVFFVSGGEVYEAGEMGGDGVEGGDVVESELAKGGLENFDAWRGVDTWCRCRRDELVGLSGRYRGGGGGVDCLDNFVDLGGYQGIC
jgi:hypothetical protein